MAFPGGWPPSPMNDAGLRVVQSASYYVYYDPTGASYHAVSNGSGGSPGNDIASTDAATVINNAITALSQGSVFIKNTGRTYTINSPILINKDNITLTGD